MPNNPTTAAITAATTTANQRQSSEQEYTPPTQLLTPNSQAQQTLQTHHNLLHLLRHRNRNQHRRSTWYRHFNVLRREVKKLCVDLNIELGPGFRAAPVRRLGRQSTDSKKGGSAGNVKRKRDHVGEKGNKERIRSAAAGRLRGWLSRELVQRCYVAFTSLLHTPSSASLALALVAVLARIANVTGVTAYLASAADEENERAMVNSQIAEGLGRFEKENIQAVMEHPLVPGRKNDGNEIEDGEDIGVAVDMDVEIYDAPAITEAPKVTPPTTVTMLAKADTTESKKKKKRRKKGNAIDEIFAGLA